jgi:hypothetical protein
LGEGQDKNTACGRIIYGDYEMSEAQFPGSIFAMSVTEENYVDFFTHKPYDRYANITHEDLAPMLWESTVRGRLEEDEERMPLLILKSPQSVSDYFEFKDTPQQERSPDKHVRMLRDEYIRIARKLIETGLSPQTGVQMTDARKCFPEKDGLMQSEPFPLELLAKQELTTEKN